MGLLYLFFTAGYFLGVKLVGREVDHSPSSSAFAPPMRVNGMDWDVFIEDS
jgi:hypothetical protein